MGRVSPNYYVQDGVVPRTRLPEVLRRIRELEARSGLRIGNVFHAGDGNLHPLICYDESIPGQAEHAERVASEILSYCIEAGGAITGEHGVGADKKAYMPKMFTPDDLDDDAAAALRVRSVRPLQPGQGVPHAAAVRRSSGAVPPAPGRAGRPRGAVLTDRSPVVQAPQDVASARCPAGRRPTRPRTADLSEGRAARNPGGAAGRCRERRPSCPRRRSHQSVDHCAGDLTATVGAGMTLASVNAALARSGQWLPLDPPAADRATIGGIVAANDSGPRRHKHGAPRDLDHRRRDGARRRHASRKAGGKVVKNVAGYDLARMLCGSRGSLARDRERDIQAGAAGRRSRGPWSRRFATRRAGADLALAVAASPTAPSAIELDSPPHRVLIRFESTARAADVQADAAASLCLAQGAQAVVVAGDEERSLWSEYDRNVWGGAVEGRRARRSSVLPTEVG